MSLTLANIPGFADLPDAALVHDLPALAIYLARISDNAALGMCRMEIFTGLYNDGDTVALPISTVDGYQYSRDELTYIWGIASTFNPATNWESGPETLWYGAWLVDQTTGLVSSIEWYYTRHRLDAAQSHDGILSVFTIGQRQKSSMILAAAAGSYTDLADSGFATDKPMTQAMLQGLNDNAKFGVLRGECIYLGEYYNGQTVNMSLAVSPADGHAYTLAQTKFASSWRWTTVGNSSVLVQPEARSGQLAPILKSINPSTGVVSITVNIVPDSSRDMMAVTGAGRIAVFGVCSRTNLMGAVPGTANAFAEIVDAFGNRVFVPGFKPRASVLLQLGKNVRESACTPEFFGPADYANGDTVPLPTSPIDGYAYARGELSYVWDWSDTTPASGTHLRTVGFTASIASTGFVSLDVWRFAAGGPIVPGLESGQHLRINVLVIAHRAVAPVPPAIGGAAIPPAGLSTTLPDAPQPYVISYFGGDGVKPTASQVLLRHVLPGANAVSGVPLPLALIGSTVGALTAATASFTVTIKRNGSTVGSFNIAAAATTGTWSFASEIIANPLDVFDFIAPATPDSTVAGIFFTISGNHLAGTEPGS